MTSTPRLRLPRARQGPGVYYGFLKRRRFLPSLTVSCSAAARCVAPRRHYVLDAQLFLLVCGPGAVNSREPSAFATLRVFRERPFVKFRSRKILGSFDGAHALAFHGTAKLRPKPG